METVFKRLIVNVNFFVQIILFAYSSNGLLHHKLSFFFTICIFKSFVLFL